MSPVIDELDINLVMSTLDRQGAPEEIRQAALQFPRQHVVQINILEKSSQFAIL